MAQRSQLRKGTWRIEDRVQDRVEIAAGQRG